MKQRLQILPLGGLEEIGKNMLLLEYGNEILIIDCGLKFPGPKSYGVEYLVNDLSYLRANKKKVKGILITHGHLDHVGGLPFLVREVSVPIYASEFTKVMIRKVFVSKGFTEDYRVEDFQDSVPFKIGEQFLVEGIPVEHSIIDAYSFAITTGAGVLIHTGDYRVGSFGEEYLSRFDSYREKGVLCLLSDSTNADVREKLISETVVQENLGRLISDCRGRAIIGMFSTQVARIRDVLDLAKRTGRRVCFIGRAIMENIDSVLGMKFLDENKDIIIELKALKNRSDNEILIICTGTQGEENSALYKMAYKRHPWVKVKATDTFIFSSSVIPGNEYGFLRMLNALYKQGVRVITNEDEQIHASGHANAAEIGKLIRAVGPRYCIPVHGEVIHLLRCRDIAVKMGVRAENVFLLENGQRLEMSEAEGARFLEKVGMKEVFVGRGSFLMGKAGVQDRRFMAERGVIVIVFAWDGGFMASVMTMGFKGLMGVDDDGLRVSLRTFLKRYKGRQAEARKKKEFFIRVVKGEVKGFLQTSCSLGEVILLVDVLV